MRDHASIEQLLVLANIEGMNAEFIHMRLPQPDRLKRLNAISIRQMRTLTANSAAWHPYHPPARPGRRPSLARGRCSLNPPPATTR
jgi:hypothetical protein